MVQEKVACYRKPAPIRHPQPLSQGLRPCQLPLHRGAKGLGYPLTQGSQALRGILLRRSQALRGTETRQFIPSGSGSLRRGSPQSRLCGGPV